VKCPRRCWTFFFHPDRHLWVFDDDFKSVGLAFTSQGKEALGALQSGRGEEPPQPTNPQASSTLKKVASLQAQGALGVFGPLKKVASLRVHGAPGAFGPLYSPL